MSRTPAVLLSAAGLLCLTVISFGPRTTRVSAHMQEPNLQRQPNASSGADRSHVFLGLGRVPNAEAAKRGEPLFKQSCAVCHGADARGGIGPNLLRSVLVLHDNEKNEEVSQVIKNGRPQSGMPGFPNLTPEERSDIAEFIQHEIELAANRGLYKYSGEMTSGDAAKGKAFFAANCASCHSATGDLAGIGNKFSDPTAMLARIAWPRTRGPRQATVTTPGGKKLTGTLAHYDDFETTLKSADGTTSTWPTPSVKVEIPDKLERHRALLPKYTDDDLHNLTRYLLTLK
ncbi:MAG: c-type cytochrome [Acidobacteria bacterium]|nr:c-type cytochrome [Acidobacteriota bacterium]